MSNESPKKKQSTRNFILTLVVSIVIVGIPLSSITLSIESSLAAPSNSSVISESSLSTITNKESLEREKLRQEILKLQAERNNLSSSQFADYGSVITAVVAVIGIIFTIWKTSSDNTQQREKEREQKERERQQRETESLRYLNQQLSSVVDKLGSEEPAIKAGAAVSLLFFLKPEANSLHEQVYWTLLANLTNQFEPSINRLLVRTFEKSIRILLQQANAQNPLDIPLADANLSRINLSELDLSQVDLIQKTRDCPSKIDLGFADLHGANLTGTQLQRVRGIKVNLQKARLSRANLSEARLQRANLEQAILHETNLVAADLKYANLKGASFYQAQLQSAHLEQADLRDAIFTDSDLADTFFKKAKFNNVTLLSILKAKNWRKAHFDDYMLQSVEALRSP